MKTPINGARLSSSFGKRKHPILGFTKMHTGTDFAAPTGTPIMASGDGKIIKASWCGGGGNCVKIKHNSTYTTVYAHMSKFARGIKKGKKLFKAKLLVMLVQLELTDLIYIISYCKWKKSKFTKIKITLRKSSKR